MKTGRQLRTCFILFGFLFLLQPWPARAQQTAEGPRLQDGQHDFDFSFGYWKTHLKRRLHPLSGSDTWVEFDGISVVRKLWNGRAGLGARIHSKPDARRSEPTWNMHGNVGAPLPGIFRLSLCRIFQISNALCAVSHRHVDHLCRTVDSNRT